MTFLVGIGLTKLSHYLQAGMNQSHPGNILNIFLSPLQIAQKFLRGVYTRRYRQRYRLRQKSCQRVVGDIVNTFHRRVAGDFLVAGESLAIFLSVGPDQFFLNIAGDIFNYIEENVVLTFNFWDDESNITDIKLFSSTSDRLTLY